MDFGSYRDSVELLEEKKSVNWLTWCCMSPFTKYVLPSFAVALIILVSVYFGMLTWLPTDDSASQSTCHLQQSYYVPCLPGQRISLDKCLELGCCWRDDLGICYHAFPSRHGYKLMRSSGNETYKEGTITALRRNSPTGKRTHNELTFNIRQVKDDHIRISLKAGAETYNNYYDRDTVDAQRVNDRTSTDKLMDLGNLVGFLPSDDSIRISKFTSRDDSNMSLNVVLQEEHFSVTLVRSEAKNSSSSSVSAVGDGVIFSTARGPLIVTDDYWEWTLYLANGNLYGLDGLELNGTTNETTRWVYDSENGTTWPPAFLAVDPRGNAAACLLNYNGPLEVQVLNGSNLVILRGLSLPKELSIDVLTGPTPLQAIRQLIDAVDSTTDTQRRLAALKPNLQGLQLCPDLDNPSTALEDLKQSINRMSTAAAPWDSHCLHRGLGLMLEHELDTKQLDLVAEARQLLASRSLVAHLTPMLFSNPKGKLRASLESESCLLRNSSVTYTGKLGTRGVVYPDWRSDRTRELSRSSLTTYLSDIKPDILVLRDSWPRDDLAVDDERKIPDWRFDYLPEKLRQLMTRRTIPLELRGSVSTSAHYIWHNEYGLSFIEFVTLGNSGNEGSTAVAVVELRGHESNSERSKPSWSGLAEMVREGITSAMLGRLPSAMYVCGAERARLNDELCVRWYGAVVAWPRILALPDKSPGGSWLSRTSARQAASLLQLRAELATYQHTILAGWAIDGAPVLSTVSIHYPGEKQPANTTYSQFLWGDSILVGLVTLPRRRQVMMWLPGKYVWRHLRQGSSVNATGNGTVPITSTVGEIITLVRPGRIVPIHEEVSGSTVETMKKKLSLRANLLCPSSSADNYYEPDTEKPPCSANGRIYYGTSAVNSGSYLLLGFEDTSLTLSNLKKTREAANCATSSENRGQSTAIGSLELLGDKKFKIDQDWCSLPVDQDSVTIACDKSTETCAAA